MAAMRYNAKVAPIKKLKAKVLESMWKKFGAFVRNVHIHLLSCLTNVEIFRDHYLAFICGDACRDLTSVLQ